MMWNRPQVSAITSSMHIHASKQQQCCSVQQKQQPPPHQQQQKQQPHYYVVHQKQQQQKYGSGVQLASMRCVICGGPFRGPTAQDNAAFQLRGGPRSYRWLFCWKAISVNQNSRKRGQPPALYVHKDCAILLEQQLDVQIQYELLWPHVKQHTGSGDSIPDCLPASSYQGISDLLEPFSSKASNTILASTFKQADAWMLQSPLACSKNASRLLSIWQPKLDKPARVLSRRLSAWRLQLSSKLQALAPICSMATTAAEAGILSSASSASASNISVITDPISVLMLHSSMHDPQVMCKMLQLSRGMTARFAAAAAGKLQLCVKAARTESVLSFALWLAQHADLLATLELDVAVCCCSEDEAGADLAITEAVSHAVAVAPGLRLTSWRTTCSKPRLLSAASCPLLSNLPHLTHLSLPDVSNEFRYIPTQLVSLELLQSTSGAQHLQVIAKHCPRLREVRLAYNMWPSKTYVGPLLLDRAAPAWSQLPLVELKFAGCRVPRGCAEPPYLSKAALSKLPSIKGLTKLTLDGCCVESSVNQFISTLSQIKSLRSLNLAETGGILTAIPGSSPLSFVDGTAALLEAARKAGKGLRMAS